MSETFHAGGLQSRQLDIGGVAILVESYKVGERFACRIDSVESGDVLARGAGPTRGDAETAALDSARLVLELRDARNAMRRSAEALRSGKDRR